MPVDHAENKIQVLVAAKHFLFRLGVKTILSVIGVEPQLHESASEAELKGILSQERLDFLLINEDLLGKDKETELTLLKSLCPNCRILVFSEQTLKDISFVYNISSSLSQRAVLEKLQEFFFEPDANSTSGKTEDLLLSEREVDVLKAIAMGYSNKEIADKLFISINTVITHRKNITEKLGIKTIAGLTVYALMNKHVGAEEVNR